MVGRMTVLQLVPALQAGGAERATVDIAAALVRAGHRALVMSAGGDMVEELRNCGAEHLQRDIGAKNPISVCTNAKYLRCFVQGEKIDLLHARSRIPAWSGYLAARSSRLPWVTTFHNVYGGASAAKKFYNGVMARGDRVIAISRFVANHIRATFGVPDDRIMLIPRGIDFAVYDPAAVTMERKEMFRRHCQIPPDIPLVIMPARLSPTKCHDLALRALSLACQQPFYCLIIGPDQGRKAYRKQLLARTQQLGLNTRVCFVDKTDLPAAYAAADLVLSLSNKQEGFGRVAAESQAMGVPVIATAIGALPETVLDGKTGWLVSADDVQALASAIQRALSLGSSQRRAMGQEGRLRARAHFDLRQMCASTLAVYESLCRASSHRH
jgi:glycosyltransferase involved in cell wall biosynthesis